MDYTKTLSIHSPEQIERWELITDAVHAKVSEISLQLWHVGRVSSAQVTACNPIGPASIIAKDIQVYIFGGAPN